MTATLDNHTKFMKISSKKKREIWDKLNKKRVLSQKKELLETKFLSNKKIYLLFGKEYYKLVGENKHFYIRKEDFSTLLTQSIIEIYQYYFSGMRSKKVRIKIDAVSNKIFVSEDILRIYFKVYTIE